MTLFKSAKSCILALIALASFACSQPSKKNTLPAQDGAVQPVTADTMLIAVLRAKGPFPLQAEIPITFRVVNPTGDTLRFTQYHTPFEGIVSNFLTVMDEHGYEIAYQGPMAKRIMPPPTNSYHTVAPGMSDSISFDLKKAYTIEKPGLYTLQYNSGTISGMANGQPIQIEVQE
ncbi:hypothetical protein [Sphingobacterium suaedae]|uniref:Intracellular proteinase inhibitor BsuPI domain-containing protein n=1 Tax=Sphingobacterium suaedae TaxID=1686402 RepID=A0ABW5KEC7_9SPHI